MIDEMYRNKFGYFHFQKPPKQKYHRVNMEQFSQKKGNFKIFTYLQIIIVVLLKSFVMLQLKKVLIEEMK